MDSKTSSKYCTAALMQIARAALELMGESYDIPSAMVSNCHGNLGHSSVLITGETSTGLGSEFTDIKAEARKRKRTYSKADAKKGIHRENVN
jgi:hypothetical protein